VNKLGYDNYSNKKIAICEHSNHSLQNSYIKAVSTSKNDYEIFIQLSFPLINPCQETTCHRRFQQWSSFKIFQILWTRLLKEYDHVVSIQWNWQSLDSISVKASLGGNDRI